MKGHEGWKCNLKSNVISFSHNTLEIKFLNDLLTEEDSFVAIVCGDRLCGDRLWR